MKNITIKKIGLFGIILLLVIVASFFFCWQGLTPRTPSLNLVPATIEEAVHIVNIDKASSFEGELAAEGHVILGVETNENVVTVYSLSNYGQFGFENGIFTLVGGAFRIPAMIIFSKNNQEEYVLQDYQEPESGSGNSQSIKKMFPEKFLDDITNTAKYDDEISRQLEVQAMEYLQRIGRNAKVSVDYVEKALITINTEASNKLLEIMPDFFPYWLGTIERLENGVRYVYETSQTKIDEGHDLVIYTKKKEDGSIVAVYEYEIIGSEVFLR